ncbi:hypothetical protein [Nonomuraea longicatena]|uniref:PepSY domain-containing protein n=1 Tax=Nonomuraea longicatena TaxID=83682 RepID=A0ABN1P1Z5_9ACTN
MRRKAVFATVVGGIALLVGARALFTSESTPEAASTRFAGPAPGDPLTPEEARRAGEIATAPSRAREKTGQVELLYVERDDAKDVVDRRASAYLYDYGDDSLTVRTVDLGNGRIVQETRDTGVQPPPSKAEEVRAAELVLADPKLGAGIRREYAKAAGRALRSAAELGLRGLIYQQRTGLCATHRCVRLFVRLPDGKHLDTSRIVVDLSAEKVHTLEW